MLNFNFKETGRLRRTFANESRMQRPAIIAAAPLTPMFGKNARPFSRQPVAIRAQQAFNMNF